MKIIQDYLGGFNVIRVVSYRQDTKRRIREGVMMTGAEVRVIQFEDGEYCQPSEAESSVELSHSVVSESLQPHEPQHARLTCPLPAPRVYSNPCPLSQCCHPTITSSVIRFSSCLQSFLASGSFPMSQLFTSGGQSIGASAAALVLPVNIQS